MNILIINHYAGSPLMGMEFRPYYFAREWIKQGHNVSIIGASYSHLRKIQPDDGKFDEVIDGVNFFWIKTPKYKSNINRIVNILFFVFKLLFNSKKYSKIINPDIVIASSTYPLDIFPAKMISKISKSRLCYEVHDLWPLSPMVIGGYSKWHPYIMIMQFAENFAVKYSDSIVSLLRNANEYLKMHGFVDEKYCCIPNGIDDNSLNKEIEDIPFEHKSLFERLKIENKIIVGYTGGHTASTALSTLLEVAYTLKHISNLFFVLIGNGVQKNILIDIVKKNKLDNVCFLDPVNKKSIPSLLKYIDIAYMGGVHSILHQYGTSFNKMSDYMLAGKPIVASIDEPLSIIKKIGCGIVVEAENVNSVANAILTLLELSDEERIEIGLKGRNYVLQELNYDKLAKDMLAFITRNEI